MMEIVFASVVHSFPILPKLKDEVVFRQTDRNDMNTGAAFELTGIHFVLADKRGLGQFS